VASCGFGLGDDCVQIGAVERDGSMEHVNVCWELGEQRGGAEEQDCEVLHEKMVAPAIKPFHR
jgi:hypothetical protein